jgi:hypothetical protein
MALGLPLVTVHILKMAAMTCKWPAIVKSPDHRLFQALQAVKKELHIQIVAMDIMKVNQVRINTNNLLK